MATTRVRGIDIYGTIIVASRPVVIIFVALKIQKEGMNRAIIFFSLAETGEFFFCLPPLFWNSGYAPAILLRELLKWTDKIEKIVERKNCIAL